MSRSIWQFGLKADLRRRSDLGWLVGRAIDVYGPELPLVTRVVCRGAERRSGRQPLRLFRTSPFHQRLDPADEGYVVLRLAPVQQIGGIRPGTKAQLVAGGCHRLPDHIRDQFRG